MNGIFLILPVLLIRYGLVALLGGNTGSRVTFFPPQEGKEKTAYWIYQLTTLALLVIPTFYQMQLETIVTQAGLLFYFSGLILYTASVIQFAKPDKQGVNKDGLYRISRNPMYVAFFFYFLGSAFMLLSWPMFFILLLHQYSVHFLILSEERWCLETFGEDYNKYMEKVPRYL
jgi:protein-S-isoprenylcysteine O-methyltransferase Ste14